MSRGRLVNRSINIVNEDAAAETTGTAVESPMATTRVYRAKCSVGPLLHTTNNF